MENKYIIIILLIIIAILAIAIGLMFISPTNAKQECKITLMSNETLNEGENIKFKLTDINGIAISNQTVKIIIIDENGTNDYKTVNTSSKGVANIKLNKSAGNYTINCSFSGNENFTGNSTTKKISIIKEIIEEPVVYQETTPSSSYSEPSSEDLRPEVDSDGKTREQADEFGWEYTTEHGGHYIGPMDRWDENAGVYHD